MDLALILKKKYNNHIWTIDGNSYAGINWLSDTEKPSEEELLSHWDSVLSEVEAEAQAKAAKKAAAEAKLTALGLTTDDLKALGLGGN
jgi:hypothetical protein